MKTQKIALAIKYSLALVAIFFSFFQAKANNKQLFDNANDAYKKGDYITAENLYDSILKSGVENASLHFNLGNCYYKTNQIGKSILHYEKALTFEPEDEDILHNLKMAQAKTSDHILTVPELKIVGWWKQFVKTFNSTGWGTLTIAFAWAALAFMALYLFTQFKSSGMLLGILFATLSLGAFALRQKVSRCENKPNTAVLLVASTYVKSAPEQSSTDLFVIHEGLKLQVKDRVGEWCKVRLSDGKVGWVPKQQLGFI
jgi:tetratricopeptide (TPR) repeat protein